MIKLDYKKRKLLALLSYGLGTIILTFKVAVPFFKSQSGNNNLLEPGSLLSYRSGSILGAFTKEDTFSELSQSIPQSNVLDSVNFYLNIPKLKIENALVHSNSTDLNPEGFIGHLAGTSMPGQSGVSFLYGHSVLPWFFNPKDYNTIFSTLHEFSSGDSFSINIGGEELIYEVEYKIQLLPQEVLPFMRSDYFGNTKNSWVILMTCTPPGLDTKRLLVIGKLR